MCTTRLQRPWDASGGSLLELLLGFSLALCLMVRVAPLLTSLQKSGSEEADRAVTEVEARVAFARFERDTRLSGAECCPFPITGSVLEASASRVVALVRLQADQPPALVEWEIAGPNLMRRWGPCPATRPETIENSLFVDHKTMLEGLQEHSRFIFFVGGRKTEPPLVATELARLDRVLLELRAAPLGCDGSAYMSTSARLGR